MWLILAFVSATFLGFYDTSKKASLKDNAVLPVLLINTALSTLIFLPFLVENILGAEWFAGSIFDTAPYPDMPENSDLSQEGHPLLRAHLLIVLKAFIVLSSWIFGYFAQQV